LKAVTRDFHRILDTQGVGFAHDRDPAAGIYDAACPTRLNYDAYY